MSLAMFNNKKIIMNLKKIYLELQSKHAIIVEDHSRVKQEYEKVNEEKKEALRDNFPSVEAEKNGYKNKMNEALKKIKILEDEANSNAYEFGLKEKQKKYEKELENSLQLAWKDSIDPNERQKLVDIVHLQSVIDELTAKLECQSSPVTLSSPNNEELITKLTEMESQLQHSAEEKHHLADRLEELSIQLTQLSEAKAVSSNEHEILVADYEKRIAELEETIASRSAEYAELLVKNAEAMEKMEANEMVIDEMKVLIDSLQADIQKKTTEIKSLKSRVEELDAIKDQIFTSNDLMQDGDEELRLVLASQDSQESLRHVLNSSFKSVIEMPGCEEPNLLDEALEEEQKNRIAELESRLEDQKNELLKEEKFLEDKSNELRISIESHTEKISELQASNDKLKEQLSNMQSEKTLSEGEKTVMQLLLKEEDQELQELIKVKNQLTFMTSQNEELEKITTDLRKQLNEKILELEEKQLHEHESEIKTLKNYVTNLQNLYKGVLVQNEDLKQQLDNVKSPLKISEGSEDVELLRNSPDSSVSGLEKTWTAGHEATINDSKNAYQFLAIKPFKVPKPVEELTPVKINKNSTQDEVETSSIFANGSYFDSINIPTTQSDMTDSNFLQSYSNLSISNSTTSFEQSKLDNKDSQSNLNSTDFELINNLSKKNTKECENIVRKFLHIKNTLVGDNDKLKSSLQAKVVAIDAINSNIDIEIKYQQMKIDLETEIQTLINDNKSLENIIKNNKAKIQQLITENAELTDDLTDRIDELNKIQEMKALEYDHDCKYRDQFNYYVQCNKVRNKNIDFTNKYTALYDENSNLKEAYSELVTNPNANKLNLIDFDTPKKHLLSPNSSRERRRSTSPTPSLDKSIHDILNQYDENEKLLEKIRDLESQNEELKTLNKKLANIKLTSYKNCAHLAELNEQRRTMKRELQTMNQRSCDFKEKFKKEQAVVEMLTNKAKEDIDMDVSVCNATFNESYFEDVSVSYAEEEIQKISSELESIRGSYQRLSSLYDEKWSDTGNLQNGNELVVSLTSSKRDEKIDKLQKEFLTYKNDLQQVKKSICSIDSKIKKLKKMEKELESLKKIKETLEEKLTEGENGTTDAQRRINELEKQVQSLSKKLEQAGIDNKDHHELTKELECKIVDLKATKENYEKTTNKLRLLLTEVEDEKSVLQAQVKTLKATDEEKSPLMIELDKYRQDGNSFETQMEGLRNLLRTSEDSKELFKEELDLIKSTPPPESEQVVSLSALIDDYQQKVESLEISVKDLREKVDHYAQENVELADKLATIQMQKDLNVTDNKMEVCDESLEKKISELMTKNQQVEAKNKELDDEMENVLTKIDELDYDNTVLQDRIYQLESNNSVKEFESRVTFELEMLRKSLETLKQENADLKVKLSKCDGNCSNSRTSSPTMANVSRQRRRSELYNQNCLLELVDEQASDIYLVQRIQDLESQLVMRNARITFLEMEIEAGFFSHRQKLDEYTEILAAYKKQNDELRDKLRSKRRKSNYCDLGVQTDVEIVVDRKASKLWMNTDKSGVLQESASEVKIIAKLQNEKAKLQEIFKERNLKIIKYQNYFKKLENPV